MEARAGTRRRIRVICVNARLPSTSDMDRTSTLESCTMHPALPTTSYVCYAHIWLGVNEPTVALVLSCSARRVPGPTLGWPWGVVSQSPTSTIEVPIVCVRADVSGVHRGRGSRFQTAPPSRARPARRLTMNENSRSIHHERQCLLFTAGRFRVSRTPVFPGPVFARSPTHAVTLAGPTHLCYDAHRTHDAMLGTCRGMSGHRYTPSVDKRPPHSYRRPAPAAVSFTPPIE
jgi:hypothetical protein